MENSTLTKFFLARLSFTCVGR